VKKDTMHLTIDSNGNPTGFYLDDDAGLPVDAILIDDATYRELLAGGRRFVGGQVVAFVPPAPSLADVQQRNLARIDTAADAVRLAVAGDPVRVVEYQTAEREAASFRDAGFDGAVPPTVQSWAEAKGWAPRAAAEDILREAAAWTQALLALRDIRLKAKEGVRAAADIDSADAITANALEAIAAVGRAAATA
jgi:hypothetical protein